VKIAQTALKLEGMFYLPGESGDEIQVKANGKPMDVLPKQNGFRGSVDLPEGESDVTITAKDRAGNIAKKVLRVSVDTKPLEIHIESAGSASGGIAAGTVVFKGRMSEPARASILGRPIPVDERGNFKFEINSLDLETAGKKAIPKIVAFTPSGKKAELALPRSDYSPPYWKDLRLAEWGEGGAVALEGIVSEPEVMVKINGVTAVADKRGVVRLAGVKLGGAQLVDSELTDSQGNVARIKRWIVTPIDKQPPTNQKTQETR
jgi:hypothetical protein